MGLITEELVVLNLKCNSKEEIIKELAQKLVDAGLVDDYSSYLTSLFKREEIAPTTVGYDIGLPHGKCSSVKKAAIAFATLEKPVVWDLATDEKVKMIFMLAIPENEDSSTHSNLLVELSRKILDDDFRIRLKNVKTRTEVVDLINAKNKYLN